MSYIYIYFQEIQMFYGNPPGFWMVNSPFLAPRLQVSNATLATISHDTRIDWLVRGPEKNPAEKW